jgi:hypothetical protein
MLQYEISPLKLAWMTNSMLLWNMRGNSVGLLARQSAGARLRRQGMRPRRRNNADITKPPITAPQSPPICQRPQILCEDHVGTYVIPFLCRWHAGIWENAKTNSRIEATVVGWRAPNQR